MKLWIINNTKFGYKNNSKDWTKSMIDYFEKFFIPFIEKNSKPGDRLIHLGNIFNSSESVNISLLLTIRDLFVKISQIMPITILDGYNEKTGISNLLQNTNQIGEPLIDNFTDKINNVHLISSDKKILEQITDQPIIFINSRIDTDILKKFTNTLFFCGFYDDMKEDENIIHVGAPYQLDKTSPNKGFYVLDTKSKKYKFINNNYSPNYNTITITDISQIEEIDEDFVNNNKVSVIVDKSLVEDKKIKIDVLLSKYNFKSITYTNDEETIEEINTSTTNMEELIREKIKNSDDQKLMSEFENILKIYKERY